MCESHSRDTLWIVNYSKKPKTSVARHLPSEYVAEVQDAGNGELDFVRENAADRGSCRVFHAQYRQPEKRRVEVL